MVKPIEEILKQDPHIKAIHPAEEWDIPEIDYSLFKKENREIQREAIKRLKDYLNGPYIVDDFADHGQRRDWKGQLKETYTGFYDYYKNNAIKINSVHAVRSAMNILRDDYKDENPQEFQMLTEKVINMTFINFEQYDSKSNQEKIEFAKQVKAEVYKVLKFLSKPKIVPQKEFESLEDFIEGQKNYWGHFLKGNEWGETRRSRSCFKRFQKLYSELEEKTTTATVQARTAEPPKKLPYKLLFETYELMSKLVFADDEGVKKYSKPNWYLIS